MNRFITVSPASVMEVDHRVLLSLRGKQSRLLSPSEARAVALQLEAAADLVEAHQVKIPVGSEAA